MNETWKSVNGYEGVYEVSSLGNIRRIAYFDNASRAHHKNKLFENMKQATTLLGYKTVKLTNRGKERVEYIHRLVAIAFIYNSENKPCVNHIDGIKEHNNYENLEWCTYLENTSHAYSLGLRVMKNKKGSRPVKMIEPSTRKTLKVFPSTHEASRQTGFAQSHIWMCCAGKAERAYGYMWEYA